MYILIDYMQDIITQREHQIVIVMARPVTVYLFAFHVRRKLNYLEVKLE